MIPKSGNRFSEKILLQQRDRAQFRFIGMELALAPDTAGKASNSNPALPAIVQAGPVSQACKAHPNEPLAIDRSSLPPIRAANTFDPDSRQIPTTKADDA
jgi:hypothetical protein